METTGTGLREKQAAPLCCTSGMSMKRWLLCIALVLLFMGLCVVVFAGEATQQLDSCNLQMGLAATLNLSSEQCEKMCQLADRFYSSAASTRGTIIEKRLEFRRLCDDPRTDQRAVNRVVEELRTLEQELFRRARQTEVEQRRLLTSEQIKKLGDMSGGYRSQGYARGAYGRRQTGVSLWLMRYR
jgi:Spy/CpxP family protein refolding chaperone